jgi:hypothetical protein
MRSEHDLRTVMTDTSDAHRNLADDTRFQSLSDQRAGYYYTDPHTGERVWLSLADALATKAALDKAAMRDADAEAGDNG